ncbi:MAG: helix-turn-helix domain-containing protein [Acidimicrobiales bacterium]
MPRSRPATATPPGTRHPGALDRRAAVHAALGEPSRLAIVDELVVSDRTPSELSARLGLASNLLAHHLDVLDEAGLVERSRSSGDGRRRYVHLRAGALDGLWSPAPLGPTERSGGPPPVAAIGAALFVCTAGSARSQLAAALWRARTGCDATAAGTDPAARVHPKAVAAARRHGLVLTGDRPLALAEVGRRPRLVVTVCDRAHEDLDPDGRRWLHWSVPDPVAAGTAAAFDATVAELAARIDRLAA